LKFELVIPIISQDQPTACISFNNHQDHFSQAWELTTVDATVVHTGCIGFGMDRLALALFATHGANPADWPTGARKVLKL
jgi:seryl-tRNA synthetase